MKKYFFISILIFISTLGLAQTECWVLFKYKGNFNHNITIRDSSSLPVNEEFINEISAEGSTLLNKSKWLNGIFISTTAGALEKIKKLSFVSEIIYPQKTIISTCTAKSSPTELTKSEILRKQISLMGGENFINKKLTGKGIKIGVIDVGFAGYKKTKALIPNIEDNLRRF